MNCSFITCLYVDFYLLAVVTQYMSCGVANSQQCMLDCAILHKNIGHGMKQFLSMVIFYMLQ